jgi:DNA-binding CsgD family transcriptional regulator
MRTHTPQPDLTARQLEILFTLMEGASNRDIAARLGVSEQTVKNQLTIMYEKIGVQNRLQLALEGLRFVSAPSGASARQRLTTGRVPGLG